MDISNWWKTKLSDIDEIMASVKKGKASVLCKSAGGRDVWMYTFGSKRDFNCRANYNSACGARDPRHYADKTGAPPVIMIVGAIHGQELEGAASLVNLISLLESGRDLRGAGGGALGEAIAEAGDCRLIIIPLMNPDGRTRCAFDSMIGRTSEELCHNGQGRWPDGSLCGWPGCKSVHPIKDAVSVLGAYFNDDGVNLMHDNFFNPMARETAALLKLADEEAPDYTLLLHSASNTSGYLIQPSYVPVFICEAVFSLAGRVSELCREAGFKHTVYGLAKEAGYPPPSFNLVSAIHHACGGVCATYESNQGLSDKPGAYTAEEILENHYLLFEGTIREAVEKLKR